MVSFERTSDWRYYRKDGMEQEMRLRHNTLGNVEEVMGKIWKRSSWVKQIEKKVKWQRSGSTEIFHQITNSPFDQGLEHINRTMKVSVGLFAITLNEHSFSFFQVENIRWSIPVLLTSPCLNVILLNARRSHTRNWAWAAPSIRVCYTLLISLKFRPC